MYPGFVTTGGILDRAKPLQAYSQVGSPKVYLDSQVDQLNASMVSSTCRIGFSGTAFGGCDHPGRLDHGARRAVIPSIPLIRNPAPNTVIHRGGADGHAQQADGHGGHPLTVTGIYLTGFGQNLSIAVSRCRAIVP